MLQFGRSEGPKRAPSLLKFVIAATVLLCIFPAFADEDKGRPFTVADSIETVHVVQQDAWGGVKSVAAFSPSGASFVLQTRQSRISTDSSADTLLLFERNQVQADLTSANQMSSPRRLVSVQYHRDDGGIRNLEWISNTEIAFLAEGKSGHIELFLVNVRQGRWVQVSHSNADIKAFSISHGTVLFYQAVPKRTDEVIDIADRSILETAFPDDSSELPIRLYRSDIATWAPKEIGSGPVRLLPLFQRIWLSPSGLYAIVFHPATGAPSTWSQYEFPEGVHAKYGTEKEQDDATSTGLLLKTRYDIVDLKSGIERPLLDAPSGYLSLNLTPPAVYWLSGDSDVVVTNSFLPLNFGSGARTTPAIVDVGLRATRVEPIMWEPSLVPSTAPRARVVETEWVARTRTVIIHMQVGPTNQPQVRRFRRAATAWVEEAAATHGEPQQEFEIALQQDLNSRPRVWISSHTCSCTKMLFDPNPHQSQMAFGHVEAIEWIDDKGTPWHGGLFLPPNYNSGARYPLVVQTHGWDPKEFQFDGPHGITSAMAAQSFVNAGFVVLQVQDNRLADSADTEESENYARGYEAGIRSLVAKGLVDPNNVGIVGFSRTVAHVVWLAATRPKLIKAAVISDGGWWGYINQMLLLNYPAELAAQIRATSGPSPLEVGLERWQKLDPLLKLAGTCTAFRLEANSAQSVLGMWETFAVLRKAGRPVDFLFFPSGSHNLSKPRERLETQGGTLDWFTFWLQNARQSGAAKNEAEYQRWLSMPHVCASSG